jgi:membrane-bound lytic murein transglycosylase D
MRFEFPDLAPPEYTSSMKKLRLAAVVVGCCCLARAQDQSVSLDDAIRSAQQWANENLDPETLRALQGMDPAKFNQFLKDFEKQFHGEYVVDLAPLKQTARALVPLLENRDETLPYALWLKTRLDYLDVADQFRLIIPAPKPAPGQPAPPIPNPAPQQERDVWVKQLARRPVPEAAKPYVQRLKPLFAAQQIPPELVWIAEVESSFDPRARSPAGAAGLFQLMPATAKQYGLSAWPSDGRLQPEASATAAAKYLRHLQAHFHDWRLSLAAYNAGEYTVDKLLAKQKSRTFDAIATHLPAETQMYVPKVEATLLRREDVRLAALDRRS